jgi:hypothetical protein
LFAKGAMPEVEGCHEENNVGCRRPNDWRGVVRAASQCAGRSTAGRDRQGRRAECRGGYRASKVIGAKVLNDANETIGKIDDLLVTRDGKEPYAVLSIGGFIGVGGKLVVVRYDSLKFVDQTIVLPGGSKDGLNMLPAFEYAK